MDGADDPMNSIGGAQPDLMQSPGGYVDPFQGMPVKESMPDFSSGIPEQTALREWESKHEQELEEKEPPASQPISVSGGSGTSVALGLAGAGILLVSVAGLAYKHKAGRCHSRVSDASGAAAKAGGVASSSTNDHHGPELAMVAITLDGVSQPLPPSSSPPV